MRVLLLGAAFAAMLGTAQEARASIVDFEDLGLPLGANTQEDFGFNSGGFFFIHGPNGFFQHLHVGSDTFWPHNGSTITLPHGDLIMTEENGNLFSLSSVDLAGWPSTEDPIHVIGTYADATTVTAILTLDGIVDGIGGAVDFQTFALPGTFTGLTSVRFLVNGTGDGNIQGNFGIDNLEVNAVGGAIPEPASITLLSLGVAGGAIRARRRHKKMRAA
jgi:hypothetical protein